ncbi:cupin domain-containing protein [bacterium]|nr:cupin domain-containing protein [bacterium]
MNVVLGSTRSLVVPELKGVSSSAAKNVKSMSSAYASVPSYVYRSAINFTGNAPDIKKATIITSSDKDIELKPTQNGGYIVEPETQTELIYGNNATKFLNKTNKFEYDTQITFPKKASGTLYIDGKKINIKENSTVLLNKGTDAKVQVEKGYPQILMTKNEYGWYQKHSNSHRDNQNLRDKFNELIYKNSHLYNGEFRANLLSDDENKNNQIVSKLKDNGFIQDEKDGYLKFKKYPVWDYQKEQLKQKGFNNEELETIKPVYEQIRQTKMDTKLTLKASADIMPAETVKKLKENGILYNNKTHNDEIFWRTNFDSEQNLRDVLNSKQIYNEEQSTVVNAWRKDSKIGYDITGLKFINDDAAVYSLDDKVNNWSMEKSCWLTNSTELSCRKNNAPSIGTSIVQADRKEPTPMSKLRKGEHLHTHPGFSDKSQTELYVVTSGSAALTVVRNGVPQIKVLREGEMAVIPPNTPHCVNSVMGEYEQVVSQIPSAFQYGLAFKQNYDLPYGYTEQGLEEQARKELLSA